MRFRLTSRLHWPAAATEGEAVSALGCKRNANAVGEGRCAPSIGGRGSCVVRSRTLDRVCLPGHNRPGRGCMCARLALSAGMHMQAQAPPCCPSLREENGHSSWKEPDMGQSSFWIYQETYKCTPIIQVSKFPDLMQDVPQRQGPSRHLPLSLYSLRFSLARAGVSRLLSTSRTVHHQQTDLVMTSLTSCSYMYREWITGIHHRDSRSHALAH